ncbi:hypothetical protein B0H17DRAFT_1217237 [Mycena rosella]|uniref:Uncharacterized protein n=1 Tax=Mycena rosella TaxID=1033263 RepID=A0AAD7C0J7_MYCRO|nr:hypothetical protein B0H17DRAFT_1217237 [Mycena rosella]
MISTARPKPKDRIESAPTFPTPAAACPARHPSRRRRRCRGPSGEDVSLWLRWAVSPTHALALLALPPLLALPAQLLPRARRRLHVLPLPPPVRIADASGFRAAAVGFRKRTTPASLRAPVHCGCRSPYGPSP